MNKIKVLIADENSESKSRLEQKLKENGGFDIICVSNGTELVHKVFQENPDIIVMDVVLSGKDGFSALEEIGKTNAKIIVTTALTSDTFVAKAMSLGVSYYMIKPCEAAVIEKRISELMNPELVQGNVGTKEFKNVVPHTANQSINNGKSKYIEEKITNIFITVGIPAHIKGYQFLREAILMAIDNPEVINSITKQLYPTIASKFDTTSSKVERAIRHAIEVAWNRGKIENINTVFGLKVYSSNEKPTNGEFIALVADKMLLEG
ncbi:MAG: sporulation transcription factor Spo0A [Clostridia bacterium]|nr:sporulation transcription factor Spo0A [Clostridia bacterium]